MRIIRGTIEKEDLCVPVRTPLEKLKIYEIGLDPPPR